MSLRSVTACLAASLLLAACAAPPPPAPAPVAAPKKKGKPAPVPAAPAPAPVAAPAPAPAPAGPENQFKVTADRSPFYNYGPQQPGGPSLSLERGTVVTVLKRGFGYSQVRLKDQQVGFVGTEDLAALTPQELAATQNAGRPADMGALPPRPGGVRRASIPPLTFDELPRPEAKPDKPEKKEKAEPKSEAAPSPTPAFRY